MLTSLTCLAAAAAFGTGNLPLGLVLLVAGLANLHLDVLAFRRKTARN